jgi:hypothetical protein
MRSLILCTVSVSMCNYCVYVGLGEIPCSPLAGIYCIHCLCVVSLSSVHDFRCFCRFVWLHFFLHLLYSSGFPVPMVSFLLCGSWSPSFVVLWMGTFFADCESVDLLFGIPCGIGIVLVVALSHCCWSAKNVPIRSTTKLGDQHPHRRPDTIVTGNPEEFSKCKKKCNQTNRHKQRKSWPLERKTTHKQWIQ